MMSNDVVDDASKQLRRPPQTLCTKPNCPRGLQDMTQFEPASSNITHKDRSIFLKVVDEFDIPLTKEEYNLLCEKVNKMRRKQCYTCRTILKKSKENPNTEGRGGCRGVSLQIKALNEKAGCVLCKRKTSVTNEHTVPTEKMRNSKGKTVCIGKYAQWTALGGKKAMWAEFSMTSVVPMCLNCNNMQPTADAMKRKDDPPTATQAYVNAKKLELGKCEDCPYRVVPRGTEWTPGVTGWPHAFEFAHRSELDKVDGVAEIVRDNTSLETAKPKLDTEMARSRFLCRCCAKIETDSRKTVPGPSEEGN